MWDERTTLHAMVNDTETLNEAAAWLGNDPSAWLDLGLDAAYESSIFNDDELAYQLHREDKLRDHLYRPPQCPKGDTRGRARARSRN